VLNKRDLLDAAATDRAMAAITGVLPRAVKVIMASGGRVDPAALLGLALGSEDVIEKPPHLARPGGGRHDHDDFDSFVVSLPEIIDPGALAARVGALPEQFDVFAGEGLRGGRRQAHAPVGAGRRGAGHPPIRSALAAERGARRPPGGHRSQRLRSRRRHRSLLGDRCICWPHPRRRWTIWSSRSIFGQPPGDVVVLSFADSDLAGIAGRLGDGARRAAERAARAICATCAIPCRSICGSSASGATPR